MTDMSFAADGSMIVVTDVGSVWRSRNAGTSWVSITKGIESFYAAAVACHPYDANTLILGTSGGIYKSSDGGDSWKGIRDGFPPLKPDSLSAPIGCVTFDRSNPSIIYAGTGVYPLTYDPPQASGRGLCYRSDDCGDTWRALSPYSGSPTCATFALWAEGDSVLAATNHGLFTSDNGGDSWRRITGLPADVVFDIAVDLQDKNTYYVSLMNPPGTTPYIGGVWISHNAGSTWSSASTGLEQHSGDAGGSFFTASIYLQIIQDSQHPSRFYTNNTSWGSTGVYASDNRCATWKCITDKVSSKEFGWLREWSVNSTPIAIDPFNSSIIYTGGSTLRSIDRGATWKQNFCVEDPPKSNHWRGNGLNITCVYDVLFDPDTPSTIYTGFWDIGFVRSVDYGKTWEPCGWGLNYYGNIFQIKKDPIDNTLLWASSGRWEWDAGELANSKDGGATWKVVGSKANGFPDFPVYGFTIAAMPDGKRRILCLSYGKGIFTSDDDGKSWTQIAKGDDLPKFGRSIEVDPSDPRILYIGDDNGNTSHSPPNLSSYRGGVWKSEDGGLNWRRLAIDATCVFDVAISQHAPNVIVVASRSTWDIKNGRPLRGGISISYDSGETWEKTLDAEYAHVVKADPNVPGRFYVGTMDHAYKDRELGEGILRSDDWGKTWKKYNDGLAMPKINAIGIDPSDSEHLIVGTPGAGIFEINSISSMQ